MNQKILFSNKHAEEWKVHHIPRKSSRFVDDLSNLEIEPSNFNNLTQSLSHKMNASPTKKTVTPPKKKQKSKKNIHFLNRRGNKGKRKLWNLCSLNISIQLLFQAYLHRELTNEYYTISLIINIFFLKKTWNHRCTYIYIYIYMIINAWVFHIFI